MIGTTRSEILYQQPNLQLLNNQNKLVWLMTNEDTDIVNKSVDFIQNNYNLRKVSTNNIWNIFLFPKSVLCEMYCSLSLSYSLL
jgi:hypothetical protein